MDVPLQPTIAKDRKEHCPDLSRGSSATALRASLLPAKLSLLHPCPSEKAHIEQTGHGRSFK